MPEAPIAPETVVDVQAEPVAAPEQPESILTEEEFRSLFARQREAIEARLAQAQQKNFARQAEKERAEAELLAEQREFEEAGEELRKLDAQIKAETDRAERARRNGLAEEYANSGALRALALHAVRLHAEQVDHGVDPIWRARHIYRDRFGTKAPPYDTWSHNGTNCEVSLQFPGGTVLCIVDDRATFSDDGFFVAQPIVTLFFPCEVVPGASAFQVPDAATLGAQIRQYPEMWKFFGLEESDMATDTSDEPVNVEAFMAQFGAQR